MSNVVEVSNLTKALGGVTAVDHVSFSRSYVLLRKATV